MLKAVDEWFVCEDVDLANHMEDYANVPTVFSENFDTHKKLSMKLQKVKSVHDYMGASCTCIGFMKHCSCYCLSC